MDTFVIYVPQFPDVSTCGHAQVSLVMESDLRGAGEVNIRLRVAPGEHGESEAREVRGVETEQQHQDSLLEHIKSETEKLGSQCSLSRPTWGASLIQIFGAMDDASSIVLRSDACIILFSMNTEFQSHSDPAINARHTRSSELRSELSFGFLGDIVSEMGIRQTRCYGF